MPTKVLTLMATVLLLALGGAASADPVEGVWQTQADDGVHAHIRMAPCGGAFCGTIARTYRGGAEYGSPNLGKVLVRDMVPRGGGAYEGRVWRPSNNKIYLGRMQLQGDRLVLKGCVAGGLICSTQTWARVR